VRGVNAHHQGSITELGELKPGGGRQTRFPYAALAAEEQDAHIYILAKDI
jgi:hypothetical protein